jgi:hypothetical protein
VQASERSSGFLSEPSPPDDQAAPALDCSDDAMRRRDDATKEIAARRASSDFGAFRAGAGVRSRCTACE